MRGYDQLINVHTCKHRYTQTQTQTNSHNEGRERGRGESRNGNGDGGGDRGRTQDGNGDGSGDKNESSSGDGNGDEDGNGDGNEEGVEEGGGEAKKRKKPHKSCRRDVGNGGDLSGKRKKRRQQRVGSVAAGPDNLENSKEAGGETQGTQSLSKNCSSRESVSPLSRLIRGFRIKYHRFPLERISASGIE